jgi:hypothetical protein
MTLRFPPWLAALAVLSGCASTTLVDPRGQALAQGRSIAARSVPAARVGCAATLRRAGQTFKFDVWMEIDSISGRLDAVGPFNTPLASVVWSDSAWRAWLPGQNILLRGAGGVLNLPVLDLKEIHPTSLVSPLLGRATRVSGPVQVVPSGTEQVAILPAESNPSWGLLLDSKTGLPLRRQTLDQGKEIEGIAYSRWKPVEGVLVPQQMIRTTPDGQVLELTVKEWTRLSELPKGHLLLKPPPGIDTITVGRGENGRKVFRIRAGTGDSTVVVLPQGAFRPAAEADSVEESGVSEDPDDSTGPDEGDDSDEETDNPPALAPSPPTVPGTAVPSGPGKH